jgi:hypothetical protein
VDQRYRESPWRNGARAFFSTAAEFLDAAVFAPRAELATPGLGQGLRIVAPGVVGSGLEHDGELIQLCAFPAEDERARPHTQSAPIARPSRRRRSQ